jgi:hypothetical protein
MVTVLEEYTAEEQRSLVRFVWAKVYKVVTYLLTLPRTLDTQDFQEIVHTYVILS